MSREIRILIIDDEKIVLDSIQRILSRFAYHVIGTLSPSEGLTRLEKERFDVVITDLMMPEMNGLEILTAMRERGIGVPAIMITGYPTIKSAVQAQRLGALDYIPKPFTRVELLGPLNRALRRIGGGEKEPVQGSKGIEEAAPEALLPRPGECFILPEHSWGLYNREGMIEIGIEASFLSSVQPVDEIEAPAENDLVEQGYAGFRIRAGAEVHSVYMPLSGRVFAVNEAALSRPAELTSRTWLIKIIPSALLNECNILKKQE